MLKIKIEINWNLTIIQDMYSVDYFNYWYALL
jgi:hypothetical protein